MTKRSSPWLPCCCYVRTERNAFANSALWGIRQRLGRPCARDQVEMARGRQCDKVPHYRCRERCGTLLLCIRNGGIKSDPFVAKRSIRSCCLVAKRGTFLRIGSEEMKNTDGTESAKKLADWMQPRYRIGPKRTPYLAGPSKGC